MNFEDIKKIKNIEDIIKNDDKLMNLIKRTLSDVEMLLKLEQIINLQIDEIKTIIENKVKN